MATTSTLTYQMLPGRDLISYYICSGQDPRGNWNEPIRSNKVFAYTFTLTLAVYAVTLVKLKLFKKEDQIATVSAKVHKPGKLSINYLIIKAFDPNVRISLFFK